MSLNLDGCCVDIVNYVNALAGMQREQRMAMFNRVPFILEWYRQIIPITFVNAVIGTGRIHKCTIANLKRLGQ